MKPAFIVSAVIGGKLQSVAAADYQEALQRGHKAVAAGAAEAWISRPFCSVTVPHPVDFPVAARAFGVGSERPGKGLAPLARPDHRQPAKEVDHHG